MKKIVFTLLMGLVCVSATYANGEKETAAKWDGSINKTKLTKYLQLSSDQHQEVADICDYFQQQMRLANNAKKDNDVKVRNAVYGNLKLMKQALNEKQYSDYLRLMALTLRNKGISVEKMDAAK